MEIKEALELTRDRISRNVTFGICASLLHVISKEKNSGKLYTGCMEYLLKYKPEDTKVHEFWWDYRNKEIRLQVLDKIIGAL